ETIRSANRKIYKLLVTKAAFIPADLEHDIVILLNHYDAWFTQFRDHKKKLRPSLEDEFVFYPVDEQSPFPKHVEEKIFRYAEKLKQETAQQAQTAENDI
ncbi:MAG TPA: hypothetical protein VGO58_09195, partial [Chitinophagaceae bacterium]|nr:hypothetical protein [Chitinophagaceae bacterium]